MAEKKSKNFTKAVSFLQGSRLETKETKRQTEFYSSVYSQQPWELNQAKVKQKCVAWSKQAGA